MLGGDLRLDLRHRFGRPPRSRVTLCPSQRTTPRAASFPLALSNTSPHPSPPPPSSTAQRTMSVRWRLRRRPLAATTHSTQVSNGAPPRIGGSPPGVMGTGGGPKSHLPQVGGSRDPRGRVLIGMTPAAIARNSAPRSMGGFPSDPPR